MSFDFKKLGLDRIAVNTAKTVGAGTAGNPVTGDIARGEVVEVAWTSSNNTASVEVRKRPTAALLMGFEFASDPGNWNFSLEGTTLTLNSGVSVASASATFWVF